nr:hypothetical transcript [Hymenolepis microstoma]
MDQLPLRYSGVHNRFELGHKDILLEFHLTQLYDIKTPCELCIYFTVAEQKCFENYEKFETFSHVLMINIRA